MDGVRIRNLSARYTTGWDPCQQMRNGDCLGNMQKFLISIFQGGSLQGIEIFTHRPNMRTPVVNMARNAERILAGVLAQKSAIENRIRLVGFIAAILNLLNVALELEMKRMLMVLVVLPMKFAIRL